MSLEISEGWKRSIIAVIIAGSVSFAGAVVNKRWQLEDQCNGYQHSQLNFDGAIAILFPTGAEHSSIKVFFRKLYNDNLVVLDCEILQEKSDRGPDAETYASWHSSPPGYLHITAYYLLILLKYALIGLLPLTVAYLGLRWVRQGFGTNK